MKYIDSDLLRKDIEFAKSVYNNPNRVVHGVADVFRQDGRAAMCDDILKKIDFLQQEKLKDKQIIIITESHGDANMDWDCRSLDDVIVLLKSAESFITDKQVEELRGQGSGPDYNTTEGRYNHLFKHKQEQLEVDLEKEMDDYFDHMELQEREMIYEDTFHKICEHFYELGKNAK